MTNSKAFFHYLVEHKIISKDQLQKCLKLSAAQKKPLFRILVDEKLFSPVTLKQVFLDFQRNQPTITTNVAPKNSKNPKLSATHPQIESLSVLPAEKKRLFSSTTQVHPQQNINPIKEEKGHSFGKYKILEEMARGGMGIVYKVEHQELKQIFALKVILAGTFASAEQIARFDREAKTAAKLNHPYLVQVVDSGEEEGHHYLCMEFVEGKTLKEKMQQSLSLRKTLLLFKKILEGLHSAHEQGIIHRDIKPANIFITKEGNPKIGDFGLAKDLSLTKVSQQVTRTGEIMGSPSYMSPEQVVGETNHIDITSDIYSVGICLYEMLTGDCPFETENIHELFYHIITTEPLPPSRKKSGLHRDIDFIVLKAISKSKNRRYQTAQEFVKDIQLFLDGFPLQAKSVALGESLFKWMKRNKKMVTSLFTIIFICLLFLGYGYWDGYQQQRSFLQQKENRFLRFYEKALHKKEAALKIDGINKTLRIQKMTLLLDALNMVNIVLSININSSKLANVESQKFEIGSLLIPLACSNGEYDLARYIAKEMNQLNSIEENLKKLLAEKVEQARNQVLKEHLRRLDTWVETLKNTVWKPGMREQALLEISKMEEEEIFNKLVKILAEGEKYFVYSEKRSVALDEFYSLMTQALGRLENPKAAPYLCKTLEAIGKKMLAFSVKDMPLAEVEYMITLAQALSVSKAKGFSEFLENLREEMGQNTLFNQRTIYVSQKLAKLDNALEKNVFSVEEFFKRGRLKLANNDIKGAIADFTQAIKLDPTSVKVYNERGMCYKRLGAFKLGLEDLTKAIQYDPQSFLSYNNRGTIKEDQRDYQGALKDYLNSIELNPDYAEAHNNLGSVQTKLNDNSGAIESFSRAIELSPQLFYSYRNRAYVRMQLRDFRGALQDYDKAVQLNPNDDIYLQRALAKKNLNNLKGALEDLNQSILLNPGSAFAYNNRGLYKKMTQDYKGALRDYNESLRINPRNHAAVANRGDLKNYFLKDKAGALKDYKYFIQLQPKLTLGYERCADIFLQQGNLEAAIECFNKAISLGPKEARLYISRADIHKKQGKVREALLDYNQAIKLQPQLVSGYYQRGLLWLSANKFKEAITDFSNTLQLNPNSLDALLNRASAFEALGKSTQALADIDKMIQLAPTSLKGYEYRAYLRVKNNKKEAALHDFYRILQAKPEHLFALYYSGIIEMDNGKVLAGKKKLKQFLKLTRQQTNPEIESMKASLFQKYPEFKGY